MREHNQVIAVLRAGKATFNESKAAFNETFNVVGRLASTSRARKRSSAGAMEVTPQPSGSSLVMATTTSPLNSFGCAQKHIGDTELDGEEEPDDSEEEPQAKKTRTEDEEHNE